MNRFANNWFAWIATAIVAGALALCSGCALRRQGEVVAGAEADQVGPRVYVAARITWNN